MANSRSRAKLTRSSVYVCTAVTLICHATLTAVGLTPRRATLSQSDTSPNNTDNYVALDRTGGLPLNSFLSLIGAHNSEWYGFDHESDVPSKISRLRKAKQSGGTPNSANHLSFIQSRHPLDSPTITYVDVDGVSVPVETNPTKAPSPDKCDGVLLYNTLGQICKGDDKDKNQKADDWRECLSLCVASSRCYYFQFRPSSSKSCRMKTDSNWPTNNCNEEEQGTTSAKADRTYEFCTSCVVSNWDPWSECSVTCSEGTRQRNRAIEDTPVPSDVCPPISEVEACWAPTRFCPVDCFVSEWSTWSPCSVTCMTGEKHRSRAVVVEAAHGGAACPHLIEHHTCDSGHLCPVDCIVSEWSEWSWCPVTCGGSQQYRTRTIQQPPENGGNMCPGGLHEERNCGTTSCARIAQPTFWNLALNTGA